MDCNLKMYYNLHQLKSKHFGKFITFGSFNNLNKINENVIKVWSSILTKVEKSKLFIKTGQLKHNIAKIALIKRFERFSI